MDDLRSRLEQALAGRYRLTGELGHGGMGVVFLAEDLKHGREVALKVLRPELARSLGVERFLREIRISAQLTHPNILTLIDSGEADGFMYYVLPYVEGESLRDRLDRETQLPLEDALRIAREVADALGYAHSLGIVHRDVKPENILFTTGHAVVADFGIARAVSEAGGDHLTETGLAMGTPAYMSPEQATGRPADARSDLYALACVLYEMLAGAPPFTGPTPQSILARKATEAVPGLRVVRGSVPPTVEAAIERALAKVPADRFATAREFVEALSGTRMPRRSPIAWLRRHRGAAVAALGLVVVIAGLAVVTARRATSPAPMSLSVTRLTRDPGVEWFPSFSPDGQWLVYSGEVSGNRDIYLLSIGGQNAMNLTADSPADDDQPAFSPDGARLAFRSEREGGGIFVMGRTGEAVRRVTRAGYRPTWSPDGTEIAYATENVDLNPQNSETNGELWVANVTTGAARQIAVEDAATPAWSPHGRRIAYFKRLGQAARGHIWTVPATGGPSVQATAGEGRDWSPAWSPDGRYLYFASDRGGTMNLWRVRMDEASGRTLAEPEPITTPATYLGHPALSADGRRIAYSDILVTGNLQKIGFDPARGTVVGDPVWVTDGSLRWTNPDPSPDGERLVFATLTEPEGHLYVSRTDGREMRLLTGDSATDRVPRWSPDGQWISFFSDRSGLLQIWKIRPDGSELTQLTSARVNLSYGVWSPDGRRMTAGSSVTGDPDDATYIFDPDRPWNGQDVRRLPPPPDSLAPFGPHDWSPDGRHVAGMINALDLGVVIHTLGANRYDRLTDYGQWPVWLPDSRRVLFVSGGKGFYVVDRVTRRVTKVYSVNRDVIGPPQLTHDGRTMYYSRRSTAADIRVVTLR